LILYEYGTPESIHNYDKFIKEMELPDAMRKIVYRMKHKAKYCLDREKDLDFLDALSLIIGHQKKPDPMKQMIEYTNKDPLKKEHKTQRLGGASL
jgi:hypothetical protein